jgi:hypothetical protein
LIVSRGLLVQEERRSGIQHRVMKFRIVRLQRRLVIQTSVGLFCDVATSVNGRFMLIVKRKKSSGLVLKVAPATRTLLVMSLPVNQPGEK